MANPRTGRARGFNGQKGGAHTLAWRDDKVILQRIEIGIRPWLEKRSDTECLAIVNAWCAEHGEPDIGRETLKIDRERWKELATERPAVTAEALAEELDHIIAVAFESFQSAKANNPGTFLSTARQAVMDKAKLLQIGGEGQAPVTLRSLILESLLGKEKE